MAVTIKSQAQIALMRESGKRLALVHEALRDAIRPGISTLEIDQMGEKMIREMGCIPNFKNYEGYPASICVSVNEEVVHGIPSADRILKEGDIVSLDAGLIYKGWHSDAARTWGVGTISPEAQRLIDVTRQSFFAGIRQAKAGNHLRNIAGAIQDCAEAAGFGVIRDLAGHGIGTRLHEDPDILNYRTFRKGVKLAPGMTLAVEPMISAGNWQVYWLDDGWTVVTADRSLSAHYENTILITEGDCEIFTLGESEQGLE